MKSLNDFHEQEFEIIDKICGFLNDKGYNAEVITNMEQSPAVVVRVVNDEEVVEKYFVAFDYGGNE